MPTIRQIRHAATDAAATKKMADAFADGLMCPISLSLLQKPFTTTEGASPPLLPFSFFRVSTPLHSHARAFCAGNTYSKKSLDEWDATRKALGLAFTDPLTGAETTGPAVHNQLLQHALDWGFLCQVRHPSLSPLLLPSPSSPPPLPLCVCAPPSSDPSSPAPLQELLKDVYRKKKALKTALKKEKAKKTQAELTPKKARAILNAIVALLKETLIERELELIVDSDSAFNAVMNTKKELKKSCVTIMGKFMTLSMLRFTFTHMRKKYSECVTHSARKGKPPPLPPTVDDLPNVTSDKLVLRNMNIV
jgi:hypothetical protein